MRRMEIIASAQVTTPPITIATGMAGSASAPAAQGRTISSTPPNPASTAATRCQPTRSPSSGTERMVTVAEQRGIGVNVSLANCRFIGPDRVMEQFKGAANFGRPSYHRKQGGIVNDIDEYLRGAAGQAHYQRKLDLIASRFADDPAIFSWELWNEVECVKSTYWMEWSEIMLVEAKKRFPRHLVTQSLGGLEGPGSQSSYARYATLADNDIAQVHRYINCGKQVLPLCHGPLDMIAADAVFHILGLCPGKPALLSESGAVQPNHAGPYKNYEKDREGIILHDVLFAAFFAGAAGPGHCWHWDFYVAKNNLWWHFARFNTAIQAINPLAENFQPFYHADGQVMRIYALAGIKHILVWLRETESNWRHELEEGKAPLTVSGYTLDLSPILDLPAGASASAYDPWKDLSHPLTASGNKLPLPDFRRSLVIRITKPMA